MNDTKIIAFYLPQFHTFPENDKWWGKGFTEWTNVKKAVPLYRNHRQPRVPKGRMYYNLLDEKVLENQMNLAKKYGIYGFCYYHYWFDGKLLLEKPLELMLKMEKKIPFCLCWANEPWTRSWDGSKEILMPQKYGTEREWELHFQYLLKYFLDNQYIKVEGKPLLVLYRTNNIPRCDDMIDYWNNRCVEEGLKGIYVAEEKNSFQTKEICKNSNAVIEFEPMYTLKFGRRKMQRVKDKIYAMINNIRYGNKLLLYQYDDVWSAILHREHKENIEKEEMLGAFVDWDNTPRKGKNGLVIEGASPAKFEKYFCQQIEIAKKLKTRFIFINAWNEWGEGTYLEPDEHWDHGYLEAILKIYNQS